METIDTTQSSEKAIPTFLKVLCILSFIGIGLGIIFGINSILKHHDEIEKLSEQSEQLEMLGFDEGFVEKTIKYGQTINYINLFANFGCLLGVLWMWKLKKKGFYVYTLFELSPTIATLIFYGNSFGSFGPLIFALSLLFPIGFVIMYASNLKHMH